MFTDDYEFSKKETSKLIKKLKEDGKEVVKAKKNDRLIDFYIDNDSYKVKNSRKEDTGNILFEVMKDERTKGLLLKSEADIFIFNFTESKTQYYIDMNKFRYYLLKNNFAYKKMFMLSDGPEVFQYLKIYSTVMNITKKGNDNGYNLIMPIYILKQLGVIL